MMGPGTDGGSKTPTITTRIVPVVWDKKGNPICKSTLSPSKSLIRAQCYMPPHDVIPIIFVPGIMGSNVEKTDKARTKAWFPPNGKIAGLGEFRRRSMQSPAERQILMNPATTQLSQGGAVMIPKGFTYLDEDEARRRGWGSIHWDSYGPILLYLEEQLNSAFMTTPLNGEFSPSGEWQPIITVAQTPPPIPRMPARPAPLDAWNPVGGAFEALTKEEHKKMGRYYFPVHACGYNWLQSNEQSAQKIAQTILDIRKHYEGTTYFNFKEVILVSHSMGGLVSRRLAQLENVKSLIAGVVHGVLPVNGAPAVYRRFVSGTEGSGVAGNIFSVIAGSTPAAVTAVLASAPGALELLPNKLYNHGQPWLFLKTKDASGHDIVAKLPENGNPYQEIYRKRDVWWEMVTEGLIDPSGMITNAQKQTKKSPLSHFLSMLTKAEVFHDTLNKSQPFHPCTYGYYGVDPKYKSFGTLTWTCYAKFNGQLTGNTLKSLPRMSQKLLDDLDRQGAYAAASGELLTPVNSSSQFDNAGLRTAIYGKESDLNSKYLTFKISDQDVSGDGTVPHQSGSGLKDHGLKQVFEMKGFDHQGSYNDKHVRETVLYSIAKIVQQVKA